MLVPNLIQQFFSMSISKEFSEISRIIQKYFPVLHTDPIFSKVLNEGYKCIPKKGAHTRQFVVTHSDSQQATKQSYMAQNYRLLQVCTYKCTCIQITVSKSFHLVNTKAIYTIKQYTNCNTTYVVYLITCNAQQLQYIESTFFTLKTLIRQHLSDINYFSSRNISVAKY